MKLTQTNSTSFWREAGNRLFLEIDEKPVELKYNLHQHEMYGAYREQGKEILKEKSQDNIQAGQQTDIERMIDFIDEKIEFNIEGALSVLEIAMNPDRETKSFAKEQITEVFGENLDMLRIVADTWVNKKIMNPALSEALDPLLAPTRRGA